MLRRGLVAAALAATVVTVSVLAVAPSAVAAGTAEATSDATDWNGSHLSTVAAGSDHATAATDGDHATAATDGDRATAANGDELVTAANDSAAPPALHAIHPSPPAQGDDGEAVAVAFESPTDATGWRLRDDEGDVARLPNRTLSGTVTLSPEPDAASAADDGPVVPLEGRLRLADGGDVLRLVAPNGSVVDGVQYDSAPDGEWYVGESDGWHWRPSGSGRSSFDPVTTRPGNATAFVLPDAPSVALDALESARERILLGGYTLTDDRVVDALIAAHRTDVDVAVLLDADPIGGTSQAQVAALDRLVDAGVNVTVLPEDGGRFPSYHPKYAVIDDRVLVATENWKPAGLGGRSSRGWGVVLSDPELAAALARVFRADATSSGALSWSRRRPQVEPTDVPASSGSYPSAFAPESVPVQSATLLLAPDNAEPELTERLRTAEDSIRIQQVSISGLDDPLLRAALAAARNGTEVEIQLASAWYTVEENRAFARRLEARADDRGLPVTVDLIEPGRAFEKNHAKGVIVDDRTVVLGSLNWNPIALRENRELLVVLEGEAVADYYGAVFEADGGAAPPRPTPIGLVAAVVAAWLAFATLVATRVRWTR